MQYVYIYDNPLLILLILISPADDAMEEQLRVAMTEIESTEQSVASHSSEAGRANFKATSNLAKKAASKARKGSEARYGPENNPNSLNYP